MIKQLTRLWSNSHFGKQKPKTEVPPMPPVKATNRADDEGPILKAAREYKEKKDAEYARSMMVSEPVTSFIKCFKDKPKRFKITEGTHSDPRLGYIFKEYTLIDKYNSESWFFTVSDFCGLRIPNYDWLTIGEEHELIKSFSSHFRKRRQRLDELKKKRRKIQSDRERQRLTKIYKEE